MSIRTRKRFEILKRDGFRCHYCGITAMSEALEVDHIVPVSKGGTDDQVNLITSCCACNGGKSNILLEDKIPSDPANIERAQEHVKQIKAYLKSQKAIVEAKKEARDFLIDWWVESVTDECPEQLVSAFSGLMSRYPLPWLIEAIEAVSVKGLRYDTARIKYFYGCLRHRANAIAED